MEPDSGNGSDDGAPALARGLALLRLLARDGALSLDRIARATAWPKPSLLRLLRTLAGAGCAARDDATGRWRATVRLADAADGELGLVQRCAAAVATLTRAAGHVVEVWAWEGGRLAMVDRADPPQGEVVVRMRLGAVRDPAELDAVTVWPLATAATARPRRPWEWVDAVHTAVPRRRLDAAVAAARAAGAACDRGPNPRGVRRFGAPVMVDGVLRGVIALATAGLGPEGRGDQRIARLVRDAARAACS